MIQGLYKGSCWAVIVASIAAVWMGEQAAGQTTPQPVDLNAWAAESFGAGTWNVAADNLSVTQSVNGLPTFYYSDFSAIQTEVKGKIRVNTSSDNDFIGFALGFEPGDTTNPAADYLLVDWKQGTQNFNFSGGSPGGVAPVGLAVSRISGIPNADEFWQHVDYPETPDGAVIELARATNLGSSGWADLQEFEFEFIFLPNRLQVFVDGVEEINITGTFSDGRLAFYNFSQPNVTYSGFTLVPDIPEPSSAMIVIAGVTGLMRRRAARG